jgi:hypothetical protein
MDNIHDWRDAGGVGVVFPRPWNTHGIDYNNLDEKDLQYSVVTEVKYHVENITNAVV